jgi:hypothetical protein
VDHVLVTVRTHDVHDRVRLADVREEAVAEALALVRPRDLATSSMRSSRTGTTATFGSIVVNG